MGPICRRTFAWHRVLAMLRLALVLSLAVLRPAHAADDALEHEQLAALVSQVELADRLAEHLADQAASTASLERTRYHFDYARLRTDLQRLRAGLQDYLVPLRAQPRDPAPLAGDYVRCDARPEASP